MDSLFADRVAGDAEDTVYAPIPISTLVDDNALPFRLYSTIGDHHVMCQDADIVLDREKKRSFEDQGIDTLYIREQDLEAYHEYLEENIVRLLDVGNGESPDTLRRYYETSKIITRRFLENPGSEESGVLARRVVHASIEYITNTDSVVSYINRIMEASSDLYTHSLHVTLYGLALARAFGVEKQDELSDLGIGLLLHDVGKLRLSLPPLEHEGPLSEDEWAIMRTHPTLGLACVGANPLVGTSARDVILDHHEALDGSGYPSGKNAADLSLHAEIAAIVNHFDRRTTSTVYRPAAPPAEVLRTMITDGKEHFHPKLLAAFVRLLAN